MVVEKAAAMEEVRAEVVMAVAKVAGTAGVGTVAAATGPEGRAEAVVAAAVVVRVVGSAAGRAAAGRR